MACSGPRPCCWTDSLPWLLAALHEAQDMVQSSGDDPWLKFWDKLDASQAVTPPAGLLKALAATMPEGTVIERCVTLINGGGGLGRPRVVAIGRWRGGRVLREAKATVPSARLWAHDRVRSSNDAFDLMHGMHRSPEGSVKKLPGWQIRRLAPDAHKLDLNEIKEAALGKELTRAMAGDVAAVHAADPNSGDILEHLLSRIAGWLEDAIALAVESVEDDYQAYVKGAVQSASQ